MLASLPPLLLAGLLVAPPTEPPVDEPAKQTAAELDAFWAEAARTVRDGDFDGYAALYHPDAVFVSDVRGTVAPIAEQLTVWKPGFEETKAGRTAAVVEFRFTQRLHSPTTAHETGLFRYLSSPADGAGAPGTTGEPAYVRFEALLVREPTGAAKSNAGPHGWRWVLERQLGVATKEAWDAAQP